MKRTRSPSDYPSSLKTIQSPSNWPSSYFDVDSLFRETARIDYSFYIEYVHRGLYRPAPHLDLICDRLMKVERGEIDRLMFFLPPRHGKSMAVTETFPSWFIGRDPNRRVIEVSYGDSLARRFGRANKNKIAEFGEEIFGIRLAQDNRSVTNWEIEGYRGGMISVGIGGGITGQGADLLIIDDPIKNRKEADSPTYRDMVWNEWKDTLRTRLQPGGAVIIILTRWHEDDLAGRLLKHEGDKWEVVSLPAIAESEDDPLGREIGEPLWPDFGFDESWAEETKRSVGSRTWSALYQQRPSPEEGEMFKRSWWNYYNVLPDSFDEIIQSWDMAFKDNDDNDFVVGQVWGRKGANKYLIDMVRDRMNFPTTLQSVLNLSARYPKAYVKLIEDKANGPAVIAMLKNKVPGLIPVNPDGGKVARAAAASAEAEAGNIYLPSPELAPWVHDFVEECAAFPNGANDDQVDCFTQAINRWTSSPKPGIRSL